MRRALQGLIRQVHPDLSPALSPEALQVNHTFLTTLNHYIDRLEGSDPSAGVFVRRKHMVFRGPPLRPLVIEFPSIPVGADAEKRAQIKAQFLANVGQSEETQANQPHLYSTHTWFHKNDQKTSITQHERPELSELHAEETNAEIWRQSLALADDPASQRADQALDYFFQKFYRQLYRRAEKTRNAAKRAKLFEELSAEAGRQAKLQVDLIFPPPPEEPAYTFEYSTAKKFVIEQGYHPDLIFFQADLSVDQQKIGMSRVCGLNLQEEAQVWLLENLWKTLRLSKTPIPVVLGFNYQANYEHAFLEIPYEFEVDQLASLLEIHVDALRLARTTLIQEARS